MKLNIEKIKQLMAEQSLTQDKLADKMGVARQSVNMWLNRAELDGLTLKTVGRLAEALGVDPKDLIC